MQDAPPIRKEVDIRAPSAPQLELRLHWFGRALEARCGYIVRLERRRHGAEHVASIAYEMPIPRYARRSRGHVQVASGEGLTTAFVSARSAPLGV
jgi:hypothetical protein